MAFGRVMKRVAEIRLRLIGLEVGGDLARGCHCCYSRRQLVVSCGERRHGGHDNSIAYNDGK